MNFVSNALISLIEKELLNHSPEIEAFLLQSLGNVVKDLMQFVEKKMSASTTTAHS